MLKASYSVEFTEGQEVEHLIYGSGKIVSIDSKVVVVYLYSSDDVKPFAKSTFYMFFMPLEFKGDDIG